MIANAKKKQKKKQVNVCFKTSEHSSKSADDNSKLITSFPVSFAP